MKYYNIYAYQGTSGYRTAAKMAKLWQNYGNDENLKTYKINSAVISEDESLSGYMSLSIPFDHPQKDLIELGTVIELLESNTIPEGMIYNCVWIGRIIKIDIDEWGNKDCTVEGPYTFIKDAVHASGCTQVADQQTDSLAIALESIISSLHTSQLSYNGSTFEERFLHTGTLVDVHIGNVPSSIENIMVGSAYLLDLFKSDTFNNLIWYTGSSGNGYDILKNILDTVYSKHINLNDPSESLSYTFSYRIDSRSINDWEAGKTIARSVYINIDEINDNSIILESAVGDRVLSLNDSIKYCKVSTSFDNLYTCYLVTCGDRSADRVGRPGAGIPYTWVPTMNRNDNTGTVNGIVNGVPEMLRKHGVHTGIIDVTSVYEGDVQHVENVNQIAADYIKKLAADRYDVDIVASDPSLVDVWSEPIEVGQYYQIVAPGLRSVIGYDPWLRCTSKKIDLMNPSKNEFSFTSYHKEALVSNYATTSRLTKLEAENKALKSELKKLKAEQDNIITDI